MPRVSLGLPVPSAIIHRVRSPLPHDRARQHKGLVVEIHRFLFGVNAASTGGGFFHPAGSGEHRCEIEGVEGQQENAAPGPDRPFSQGDGQQQAHAAEDQGSGDLLK